MWHGQRFAKWDTRIILLGQLDQVDCQLGLVKATLRRWHWRKVFPKVRQGYQTLDWEMNALQQGLYQVMADVSGGEVRIDNTWVEVLEERLFRCKAQIYIAPKFIKPGATIAGAQMDLARTMIRQAETSAAKLTHEGELNLWVVRYLNRASDLLFILARFIEQLLGVNVELMHA
jgi:cob(I)alamin adenosyltransferase